MHMLTNPSTQTVLGIAGRRLTDGISDAVTTATWSARQKIGKVFDRAATADFGDFRPQTGSPLRTEGLYGPCRDLPA